MSKKLDCSKVNPAAGCGHVVRGKDEAELMKNAAAHAKEHGIEPTPELAAKLKQYIEEE